MLEGEEREDDFDSFLLFSFEKYRIVVCSSPYGAGPAPPYVPGPAYAQQQPGQAGYPPPTSQQVSPHTTGHIYSIKFNFNADEHKIYH